MAARPAVLFGGVRIAPSPRLRERLRTLARPYVVAADAGAASAFAFGYVPDVVIGDLDSIDAETLARIEREAVPVEPYPRDKNATDGQLALERALREQPGETYLLGFLRGPRLDHAVANVLLLALAPPGTVLLEEQNECWLVRSGESHAWRPDPGEIVSLIPLSGDATGVTTQGLRWPLADAVLRLGDTWGLSDEPLETDVRVSLGGGLLLVTRHWPGAVPGPGSDVPARRS